MFIHTVPIYHYSRGNTHVFKKNGQPGAHSWTIFFHCNLNSVKIPFRSHPIVVNWSLCNFAHDMAAVAYVKILCDMTPYKTNFSNKNDLNSNGISIRVMGPSATVLKDVLISMSDERIQIQTILKVTVFYMPFLFHLNALGSSKIVCPSLLSTPIPDVQPHLDCLDLFTLCFVLYRISC